MGPVQCCKYPLIAREGLYRRIGDLGQIPLEEFLCFAGSIPAKPGVNDKGPAGFSHGQKMRRTAIGCDHAFLHQMLGSHFFIGLYAADLAFVIQNPAEFLAILHHQFVAFAVFPQGLVGLHQRLEGVGPGDQLVVVPGDITVHGGIAEFGFRLYDGAEEFIVPDLAFVADRDLAYQCGAQIPLGEGAEIPANRLRQHGDHVTVEIHRCAACHQRLIQPLQPVQKSSWIGDCHIKQPAVAGDLSVERVIDILGAGRVNGDKVQVGQVGTIFFQGLALLGESQPIGRVSVGPGRWQSGSRGTVVVLQPRCSRLANHRHDLGRGFAVLNRVP